MITNYFKCPHFRRSQIKVYQIFQTYSGTITNRWEKFKTMVNYQIFSIFKLMIGSKVVRSANISQKISRLHLEKLTCGMIGSILVYSCHNSLCSKVPKQWPFFKKKLMYGFLWLKLFIWVYFQWILTGSLQKFRFWGSNFSKMGVFHWFLTMFAMVMTPGVVKPQYLSFYLTKIENQGQFWNPHDQ